MADLSPEARNSVALQKEMFRLAEHEHGLKLSVIARTRGIPLSTLKGWNTDAQMPAWAIGALRLPDDLTSLVLTPWDKFVGTNEPGDGDLDALAEETSAFTEGYVRARSPRSPGGSTVTPIERANLKNHARRLTAVARSASAS